ncbi:MAG: hypothetical protein OCD00_10085 [Colwellia sp.]
MNIAFMVSFAGPDSADLLADLAKFTHDNEGKWLNSKVSYLEGYIAANIKVSLPAENAAIVKANFMAKKDLTVKIEDISTEYQAPKKPIKLTIKANDRPGLIFEITRLVKEFGAEIVHIETHRLQVQSISGTVFISDLVLNIQEDSNIELLMSEIKTIEDSLIITQES